MQGATELEKLRVAKRVSEGGHDIPTDIIERRYNLGINNFFNLYKDEVDFWTIVDNASSPRKLVADSDEIYDVERYNLIQSYVR